MSVNEAVEAITKERNELSEQLSDLTYKHELLSQVSFRPFHFGHSEEILTL